MSGMDVGRLLAMARKELREFRRTPFILGAMVVLPVVFIVEPLIDIFRLGNSTPASVVQKVVGVTFLLMLIVHLDLPVFALAADPHPAPASASLHSCPPP